MTTAAVELWGTTIGYVATNGGERFVRFQYDPDFADFGIEPAGIVRVFVGKVRILCAAGRLVEWRGREV